MHTFKSTVNGKEVAWEIALPFGVIRALTSKLGVNLLDPDKPVKDTGVTSFLTMRHDLEMFVDVVWEIVQQQATREGIDTVAFAASLDGAAMKACRDAFFAEWVDFFRESGVPEKAADLRKRMDICDASAMEIANVDTKEMMAPVRRALQNAISAG